MHNKKEWSRLMRDVRRKVKTDPDGEVIKLNWLYDHGDRSDRLYDLLSQAVPFNI